MISELGCGTGVVGLSAAALGGEVILTDLPVYIPAVLENIKANTHRDTGRVTAAALDLKGTTSFRSLVLAGAALRGAAWHCEVRCLARRCHRHLLREIRTSG